MTSIAMSNTNESSARLSNAVSSVVLSGTDCRTYYRFALFSISLTVFLDLAIAVLSILKFAIFDAISFGVMATFSGASAAAIYFLLRYSNMPDSEHWLTRAQTHIGGSSIIAFLLFSYSSSLRAPFSASLHACLSSTTQDVLGHFRCQLVLIMGAVSWAAPFAMIIAAWVVYFSAIKVANAHPLSFAPNARLTIWVWRHINVAEANVAQQGQVRLT